MSTLSERLRELRGKSSQKEMADAVGIKWNAWARYERGDVSPGAEILTRICKIHACSADWLLGLAEKGSCSHGENNSAQTDWRARALAAEAKLERANRALGHALKGFGELQEAVR